MAYPNTGLVHSDAVTFGSAKIEKSPDGTTWTNLGLARNVVFKENFAMTKIQADNGPNIRNNIGEHTCDITFNSLELYLPTLASMRGGIDLLSVTGTSYTTDTDIYTTGSVDYGLPLYLENQGNTSTGLAVVVTVNSISTAGAPTLMKSTRDYTVITDANGKEAVVMLSTHNLGKFSDTQGLKIKYTYRPILSRTLTSGGLTEITDLYYRLTNLQVVSGVSKYRTITVYSGAISAGLNFAFKSCNEADPTLEIPINISCKIDSTRTIGDQLFGISDEIGIS